MAKSHEVDEFVTMEHRNGSAYTIHMIPSSQIPALPYAPDSLALARATCNGRAITREYAFTSGEQVEAEFPIAERG